MPDDRRLTISTASARLSADDVQQHHFSTVRRGFDPDEVRGMLELVARELAVAAEREAELRAALSDAEQRARSPEIDEETLTAVLGQETTRVLRAARDAAADIVSKAEEEAARVRAEAQEAAEQLQGRAEQHAAEHVAQSESAAAEMRRRAQEDATARVEHARAEAEAMLSQARTDCRAMVQEAQELRARVLADLAKRRRSLHAQIDQLRAGRERLAQTIHGVRQVVDEVAEELLHAEDEARLAADAARAAPLPDDALLDELAADAPDPVEGGAEQASASSAVGRGPAAASPAPERLAEPEPERLAEPEPELVPTGAAPVGQASPAADGGTADASGPRRETGANGSTGAGGADAEAGEHPGAEAHDVAAGERPPERDVDALFARLRASRGGRGAGGSSGAGSSGGTDAGSGRARPSARNGDVAPGTSGGVSPAFAAIDDDGPAVRILQHDATPRPRRRHVARPGVPEPVPPAVDRPVEGPVAAGGSLTPASAAVDTGGDAPVEGATRGTGPAGTGPAGTGLAGTGPVETGPAETGLAGAGLAGAGLAETGLAGTGLAGTVSEDETGSGSEDEEVPEGDAASPADPALARRDELVRPVVAAMARRLKRALQDDQNDLLDRIRNAGAGRGGADAPPGGSVLPAEDEHRARYAAAVREHLDRAARAGAEFCGARGADAPGMGEVAEELAAALVSALRRRLDLTGDPADDQQAAERVGAAFREWKGSRVEALVTDHVVAAFSRAVVAGTPAGQELRWVVDDDGGPCADCDDNALDDGVPAGKEFPTGHRHPPAHAGCRCLLVPASP